MSTSATCRFCGAALTESFCDLGLSPLANSYVSADRLDQGERFYPLHAYVCSECYLVQLAEFETPEQIFGDYAYFSSFSRSWLEHARTYVEQTSARFDLGPSNQIVEIASNDGYLLQYFVERELPVLGIEPAANVAAAAQERGIPTLVEFFGTELATRLARRGHDCRPVARQQRARARARPQRLRRRHGHVALTPTASSPWSSRTSSS